MAIKEITDTKMYNIYNSKFILEKPIGTDLESCNKIIDEIDKYVDTEDIFILDHYLGKSNIRDLINHKPRDINQISIFLNEVDNVNHRLEYFNNVGIFKDMIQSHAMAILYYLVPYVFDTDKRNNLKINNSVQSFQFNGSSSLDQDEGIIVVLDNFDILHLR